MGRLDSAHLGETLKPVLRLLASGTSKPIVKQRAIWNLSGGQLCTALPILRNLDARQPQILF